MIELIENIDKLAAALESHEFYDFHDAEIVSIKFDRNDSVTLELILQIHRRIAEFKIDGKPFERFKNFDAAFKFHNLRLIQLSGFGHQNVIEELIVTPDNQGYIVHFREVFGCDLKFGCARMEFTGVNVFDIEKKRFEPDLEKIKKAFDCNKT